MNSQAEIVCTLTPTSAEVFVANAVCKVGEGVNATKPNPRLETRLSAVAKYPYIVASEHDVKFGDVIVNCDDDFQIRREFVVRNQSVVPAAYKVRRDSPPRPLSWWSWGSLVLSLTRRRVNPPDLQILRVESDRDPVFTVTPDSGTIPPGSEVNMVVYFTPTTSGTYSTDTYKIVTPGGNTETLHFSGRYVTSLSLLCTPLIQQVVVRPH